MDYLGELLRGPAGDFQYASLSGRWEDAFLELTAPGQAVYPSDGERCVNQTWRCTVFQGGIYVLSACAAPLHTSDTEDYIQHVRFFEASPASVRENMRDSLNDTFAGPDDYLALSKQQTTLSPGWLERRNPFEMPFQERNDIVSGPDVLTRLACCCLWRGWRMAEPEPFPEQIPLQPDNTAPSDQRNGNTAGSDQEDASAPASGQPDNPASEPEQPDSLRTDEKAADSPTGAAKGLAVLVPVPYCYPPAYVRYCQAVIDKVTGCVPGGLRRFLSFATNPAEEDQEKFSLFFAPEGTPLNPDICIVMLFPGREMLDGLDAFQLPPEVYELIRDAAQDPLRDLEGHTLGDVFRELEQYTQMPDLSMKRYVQYQEDQLPLTWEHLREFNRELEGLSGEAQQTLVARIRRRLARQNLNSLDPIISQDPGSYNFAPLEKLSGFLLEYFRVVLALQKRVGPELSGTLLDRYGREVAGWSPEQLRTCRKWLTKEGAAQSPLRMLQLLDGGVLWSYSEHLEKLIREKSAVLANSFLSDLPDALTEDTIDALLIRLEEVQRQCSDADISKAVRRFADKMAVVLEKDSLPEEKILEIFKRFPALMEPLATLYQFWEHETTERKKREGVVAKFEEKLKQSSESERAGRLQRNLDRGSVNVRREVSLRDFLRACEEAERRAWPDVFTSYAEYREALARFIDEYQLGIWLGPRVPWNALFADLLAYQALTGREDICLWRANRGSPSTLCYRRTVSSALDAVELIRATERNESSGVDLASCTYVLYCFDMAGMIPRRIKAVLWPKLRRPRNPDGSPYVPEPVNLPEPESIPEGYDSEADYQEAEYAAMEYGLDLPEEAETETSGKQKQSGKRRGGRRAAEKKSAAAQIPLTAKMIAIAVLAGVITAMILTALVLLRVGHFPVSQDAREPRLEYQDTAAPQDGS